MVKSNPAPSSPDIVLVENDEDDGSEEEETISLTGFSKSDTEGVHVATAVHEKACLGDVLYATWCDNQIHKGNDEIKQCDSMVCDHPQFGKRCEAPDQVGPPISYMEELRVFKPVVSTNNPMGLCRFYRMSPEKANVLVGPKSAECARRIHHLIEIAKRIGRQLTVVVFEGESISPWCLLGDLHLWLALSQFTIHTPEEAKIGIRICMYCCPFCAYVIKNRTAFLNHIIVGHYWGSFSCGKCLAFTTDTARQMMRHLTHCGQSEMEHRKARSACSKAHQDSKSGRTYKGGKKKKEGVSTAKQEKPRSSPTGSNPVASSQEHAKRQ